MDGRLINPASECVRCPNGKTRRSRLFTRIESAGSIGGSAKSTSLVRRIASAHSASLCSNHSRPAWNANWAWSLPLIVSNVAIHVIGLGLINESVVRVLSGALPHRRFMPTFAVGMGAAVLLATALHGIEAATWATAYRLLGALPDTKSAILYSLSAWTSYGHANLFLEEQWQLMGALEALNGMLLFGLTTAFLFCMAEICGVRRRSILKV